MIGIVNIKNEAVNSSVHNNVTFADLNCHCQTGRGYVVSGEGRNRVYGYRVGVQCALGDIEVSEWCQMVRDLIKRAGEENLQQHLFEYVTEHCLWLKSKKLREHKALELHAARIFDNQEWVDFIEFNRKYRPEVFRSVELVEVVPECCKKPGLMTRKRLESSPLGAGENYSSAPRAADAVAPQGHFLRCAPGTLCTGLRAQCPHCGKWTQIEICND